MQDPKLIDLKFYQGATWFYRLRYQDVDGNPIDLTGYSARMHIRKDISDDEPLFILGSDPSVVTRPLNGEITIVPASGIMELKIEATETESVDMNHSPATWVYDLELIDSTGFVVRIMEGSIDASPEVTRPDVF